MENVVKGWATSGIGFLIWIMAILHLSGVYKLPSAGLATTWEVVIAGVVGFAFFRVPYGKMEESIISLWDSIVGMFKKKTDA